jgi:DNA-binding transcriptional ArsR family regulator
VARRNELVESSLDLAWTQWTALGVRGVQRPPETAVDLESLLLFTAGLASRDPRLYDEACDWCTRYGLRFVAIGRLRNLARNFTAHTRDAFGRMAATINANSSTRWPTAEAAEKIKLSGKSQLAPFDTHGASLLRLRCVFGTSPRAEVVLALLTAAASTWSSASKFVDLGYQKAAILRTLDELALGGLLESRRDGNRNLYRLAGSDLRKLLHPLPARHGGWHLALPLLDRALRIDEQFGRAAPIARAVEATRFLEEHADTLKVLDAPPPTLRDEDRYWDELALWLAQRLTRP